MDQETLVDRDLSIGNDVIGLLAAAGIPVSDAFWVYAPQTEEWRLMLSSPKVDELGIHDAYLAFSKALHDSPLFDDIPLRRISLLSPHDTLVERFEHFERHPYEGALHVVRFDRGARPPEFRVTFAPYTGSGGVLPMLSFDDEVELVNFLHKQVKMDDIETTVALRQLKARRSHSFPSVRLTTAQLRRLGLLRGLHPGNRG